MKKTCLFAVLAALCLTACNENKQDPAPDVTTAAQTTAFTVETAAETSETAAVPFSVPEVTFEFDAPPVTPETTAAAATATTAAPAETDDGRITITIPVLTTGPRYAVIDAEPAVREPVFRVAQTEEDRPRITPQDASKLDVERLRGVWTYMPLERMHIESGKIVSGGLSQIEICVAEDGVFSAYMVSADEWNKSYLIGNGKVTIEGKEYVLRLDDGRLMLSGHPASFEPLNTLEITEPDDLLCINRYSNGVILYDRQYRRVEKAQERALSRSGVDTLTDGCWENVAIEKKVRVYDAGVMGGSFEFYVPGEAFYTSGKVYLEQGFDNECKLHYYYNFYDDDGGKERLILSIDAEGWFQDNLGRKGLILSECWHTYLADQLGLGSNQFYEMPDPGSLRDMQ